MLKCLENPYLGNCQNPKTKYQIYDLFWRFFYESYVNKTTYSHCVDIIMSYIVQFQFGSLLGTSLNWFSTKWLVAKDMFGKVKHRLAKDKMALVQH